MEDDDKPHLWAQAVDEAFDAGDDNDDEEPEYSDNFEATIDEDKPKIEPQDDSKDKIIDYEKVLKEQKEAMNKSESFIKESDISKPSNLNVSKERVNTSKDRNPASQFKSVPQKDIFPSEIKEKSKPQISVENQRKPKKVEYDESEEDLEDIQDSQDILGN